MSPSCVKLHKMKSAGLCYQVCHKDRRVPTGESSHKIFKEIAGRNEKEVGFINTIV